MEEREKEILSLGVILSFLAYAMLGVFLAVLAYTAFGFLLNTSMPVIDVVSDSMTPNINVGDLVVVQGVQPQDINVGDVIVFEVKEESYPVIHRVIYINGDGTFGTAGDANNGRQLPYEKSINYGQIQGKAISQIPYLGLIKIFIVGLLLPNFVNVIILGIIALTVYCWMSRQSNKK